MQMGNLGFCLKIGPISFTKPTCYDASCGKAAFFFLDKKQYVKNPPMFFPMDFLGDFPTRSWIFPTKLEENPKTAWSLVEIPICKPSQPSLVPDPDPDPAVHHPSVLGSPWNTVERRGTVDGRTVVGLTWAALWWCVAFQCCYPFVSCQAQEKTGLFRNVFFSRLSKKEVS